MSDRIKVAGLSVAETLYEFIEAEALPGSGVASDRFWTGLAALIREFGARNRQLLAIRDDLQARIDTYHLTHAPGPLDSADYERFLRDIGYLLSDPAPLAVRTANVDDEIAAIAAYVASLAPGPAIPTPEDYSTEGLSDQERQEAIVRGGQIFLTNCTACHNFTGAGGAMPRGGYAPSDLNTSPKHIYEAMLTGPGPMDVFSNGNLSPEEKRDVIAYIQSMKEQPGYGGFSLGALGPVSEGLFAWLVGLGACVAFAVWIAAHTTRSSKTKKESQA